MRAEETANFAKKTDHHHSAWATPMPISLHSPTAIRYSAWTRVFEYEQARLSVIRIHAESARLLLMQLEITSFSEARPTLTGMRKETQFGFEDGFDGRGHRRINGPITISHFRGRQSPWYFPHMTRSHVLAGLLFIAALNCSKSCSCSRGSSAYAGRALASVTNGTKQDAVVFVAFGADSAVVASDWVAFCHATSKLNCSFPIQSNSSTTLPLSGKYLNATFSFNGQGCDATKAELNINNSKWYDVVDVSLVDGY